MEVVRMECTNIYFIGSVELGAVKIGRSYNPEKRLAELQTGNSHKLVLYGVIENVTADCETELHRILDHIRQKGEWFKLTDELIHFMINKTAEKSYNFKINNNSKTYTDPLDIAIDKIVKPTKNGIGWVSENNLIWVIRRYLTLNDESPHFSEKKLRQKLENREIYAYNSGGEWIYRDHYADEKEIQPEHYIGPVTILNDGDKEDWDLKWDLKLERDTRKCRNIKVSTGYSQITSYKEGSITVSTITTKAPRIKHNVIIYKGGVYDAIID
jgi:hypothetical protein